MANFWTALPAPFLAQAPLEDVTDAAFRRMIARHGKPHIMFTEFTSADGLVLAPEHAQKVLRKKLEFDAIERPIVAQLFSSVPERMERAAAIVAQLEFDGLDINMGCPVHEVVKSGCGAALINNSALAQELVRAARRGAPHLPISVKTRIGYRANELGSWLPALLEVAPIAITIHARTRNEMSAVPARWECIKQAVEIRNMLGSNTLIIGNGDVCDVRHARYLAKKTDCDGIMLGRALYGNPWLFSNSKEFENKGVRTAKEKIEALMEHLELFDKLMSETANYATMKKHFKAYISGWDGAKGLRIKIMETASPTEARAILRDAIISP